MSKRYEELQELGRLRKQRLLDAQALYKLFNDADTVEAWIDEKVGLRYWSVPSWAITLRLLTNAFWQLFVISEYKK